MKKWLLMYHPLTVPAAASFLYCSASQCPDAKAITSMYEDFVSPLARPVKHLVHHLQLKSEPAQVLQPLHPSARHTNTITLQQAIHFLITTSVSWCGRANAWPHHQSYLAASPILGSGGRPPMENSPSEQCKAPQTRHHGWINIIMHTLMLLGKDYYI